ncbi:hypothetical protein QJ857_gp0961 [Tupanvirus soda lake]|uniref:Uncharacterized protein n=2 Tax=Tupanvirus TaxID=2094720 RepID=A0A6N1NUJ4_9VIRU|nr:hypothetical protein QJ857_gp0961 [Tupanvirus soda lake]QKU35093.1 hypothetical protein [Tupanvirus soda lake]
MNVQDIISKALIYYDSAQPVIRYLKKYTHNDGKKTNNDNQRSIFIFREKGTEKVILETEVEILAIYYDKHKFWSWAWSQVGLINSENYLAKEILLYALKLGSDLSYIKSILTTSRGVIKDTTQIDINLAIGSSIIKQPYIFPFVFPIENNNLVYFFILLNKEELDKLAEKIKDNPSIELEID